MQHGQRRWLAFAIALYFVFDTLQTPSNIEFATSSHRKTSLILAILSLAYLRFVRDNRRTLGWFIFNIVTFMLAMMIYEQAFFFLLLHPVIAYVEDRRSAEFAWNRRYLWLTIRDSLFHVIVVLIYVYMLLTLFSNKNLQLSASHLLSQFSLGLHLLLNPLALIERLLTAVSVSQVWFVAALSILAALFFGLWIRSLPSAHHGHLFGSRSWDSALSFSTSQTPHPPFGDTARTYGLSMFHPSAPA